MADTSPVTAAGLFSLDATHAPVPLTGVSIEADLSGFCARVSVAHRYVNTEDKPIEAVYVFPLDEGAAVCGFEAVVDGTLVVGEVQDREKAFEMYDEAMEQGHGAFLLDEERPDVFQASVGNLPPGKEVLVRLTYVTELQIENVTVTQSGSHTVTQSGSHTVTQSTSPSVKQSDSGARIRFTIPTTVSPRYAPADDHKGVGRSDAETLNPPVAWSVPYGLDLSVRLSMPGTIKTIESPSHPISVSLNGAAGSVKLAQSQAALDRDFVLSIEAEDINAPHAWADRDQDGTGAVAVAFVPTFAATAAPAEIIFLVDRSGSMGGTSIAEVRNALQLCLRSMIAGCRFNIIGFGSTHESLFPESRAYDQASLDEASKYVAALDANLGGTEILPALTAALEQPHQAELSRQIVVLTDGEVTNTDAVLALAAKHAADARIFTFGIGAGASQHLVRGLARAGNGSAEFVYPGERIEKKVVRQFGRLLSPRVDAVNIEWIGGKVTQAPAKVPPVFAGDRLLVYGFVRAEFPTAVRLSAASASGPLSFDVPIDSPKAASARTVATLAARARIRELEEGDEWLTARGSRQANRKQTSARREIIDLSVRYGLISRETSFVAIERRERPVIGDTQLRKVPIALTSGWGGVEQLVRAHQWLQADTGTVSLHRAMPSLAAYSLGEAYSDAAPLIAEDVQQPLRPVHKSRPASNAGPSEPPSPRPAGLDPLIALQAADGSWELNDELAAIFGHNLAQLEAALAGARGSKSDLRRAWATSLALAWLQLNTAGQKDEWRLLGAKARKWLDDVEATPAGGGAWLDAARWFLSSERPWGQV